MQTGEVFLSVRQMVEFILRSGHIDAGYTSAKRALDGTKVHQRIQKAKKKEAKQFGVVYLCEATLRTRLVCRGITFHIDGRADGIWVAPDGIIIEEIKSTVQPVSQLVKDTTHWHWAQAKCYAYIYGEAKAAERRAANEGVYANTPDAAPDDSPTTITVAIIYGQVETEETVTFTEVFSMDALAAFFTGLIERYWDFAHMDLNRQTVRAETAKKLPFPFGTYRKGQRELAVAVFAAIKQKRKLFAQAPTGIGKTISTLYPSVKSMAENMGEKIFYITAKVAARQVAEDAFRLMAARGLVIRVITLTARDKICFCTQRLCNPIDCSFADGHFDRVNAAILDCVTHNCLITRDVVEAYAHKHRVCPAEYQLDVASFCDAIICDYNHVYDPKAKLQRFFQFGGDYILLNDEAHNLIDRAREMFSAGLFRHDFTALRKTLGRKHPLYKSMGLIAKAIKHTFEGHTREAFCVKASPDELLPLLMGFAGIADSWFQQNPQDPQCEPLLTLYFSVLDFLRVYELYDERYTTYHEPANGYIRLYCLDPSHLLANEQKKSRACVFFSATLTPLPYFRAVLGGSGDDFTLRLHSPFARENLCLLVDDTISTKYKDRALSYNAVADRLYGMVSGAPGHYLAFFSSYAYLSEVCDAFTARYPDIETIIQAQAMNDGEREQFLQRFAADARDTMLGFAVLGGAFSEGIDLKGTQLIGAAIVGVGMPLISEERNVLVNYYNENGGNGFAYAYIFPGMNKVLQAAGRVIRTETDCGVVLLIDSRFREPTYRRLFPPEWDGFIRLGITRDMDGVLRAFWDMH